MLPCDALESRGPDPWKALCLSSVGLNWLPHGLGTEASFAPWASLHPIPYSQFFHPSDFPRAQNETAANHGMGSQN